MKTIVISGALGKDAETRTTQGGDSVTSFNVAVEDRQGKEKATLWFTCSLWGKRGESVLPYLKDKTQIAVSGELANREYTDKEGNKRYSLDVRVNDLTLLGGKQEASKPDTKWKPGDDAPASFDEDSIPF